ncbi:MAG TPA: hypothetical protein VNO55_30955 [Polyangia bacterium]|nr:hypothetical protein [Polyangia bacterium]
MRRLSLFGLALLAVGCGSSSSSGGGSGGASGSGGAISGTGGALTGSGGQAGTGSGGAAATGGTVGGGGSGGASGSGGAVDSGGGNDSAPGDGNGGGSCPAGAVICEDFEKYAANATDLSPDWVTYKYGGATLQVDTTKAFKGTKALHITAPVGGRKYADIIKQNPLDKELLPLKHFGRVMVWLTSQPSTAHWNINQASGPAASPNPIEISKYSYGGQNSVLSPNYTLRPPIGDNLTPLRGGGPEGTDMNTALFDCGPNTRTQKVDNGRWVCWEWMFDGQKNQLRLYLDGTEQTEAAVNGVAGTCGAWQGPKMFTKMIIGWEQYTEASDKVQSAWLDDLVVSDQRVGCPAP